MKKVLFALSLFSILLLVVTSGCTMKASRLGSFKPTPTVLSLFDAEQQDMQLAVSSAAEMPPAKAASDSSPKAVSSDDDDDDDDDDETVTYTDRPEKYTLNKGEWPFCIARRYNLNPLDLLNANGLSLESKPDVGFVLKIPQTGEWPESRFGHRWIRAHPAMHQVGAGETLYTISCLYGDIDPSQIVEANELPEPYKIYAGQMLRIP
ncbi:MAG: LysM peptidoglycan-binding domain-containing protein [Leptolinea sp.]|nr:LysM peptidoglycan-binding domain-containing protein [Leptolinea sp.]